MLFRKRVRNILDNILKTMWTNQCLTHLVAFKKSILSWPHKLARIKRCVNSVCKQRHVKQFVFFTQQFYWQLSISLSPSFSDNQEGNELATFQPWNPQNSDISSVSFSESIMVTHINKVLVSQRNLSFPFPSWGPCKQLHRMMWALFTCF